MFISLEGTDGAGKSVQIEKLKKYLEKDLGKEVVSIHDPGSTKISEKLRKILLDVENKDMSYKCEALLYAASRAQMVDEIIIPSLNDNKVVLSDRFVDSSYVYQGVTRGLGYDKIKTLNEFATSGLYPDITFFLSVDPKISLNRRSKASKLDRMELEGYKFQEKVRDAYLENAKKEPHRIKIIDASKTIDEVHKEIIEIINKIIK